MRNLAVVGLDFDQRVQVRHGSRGRLTQHPHAGQLAAGVVGPVQGLQGLHQQRQPLRRPRPPRDQRPQFAAKDNPFRLAGRFRWRLEWQGWTRIRIKHREKERSELAA